MSYHAAVHVPWMWQEYPEIRCDAPNCTAVIRVGANGRPPPSWFLAGRAAPRWSLERVVHADGRMARVDLCPQHRVAARAP